MAWRNIWRNPTRSAVVIGAIALGILAAIFLSGFATGMAKNYVNTAIANVVSHLQIHDPRWKEDQEVKYDIPDALRKGQILEEDPRVKAISLRTVVNGMISSPRAARGVQIRGVDMASESAVSGLDGNITEGDPLSGERRNEMLLSEGLAEKLSVGLRGKVVLTFQDEQNNITAGAFRVVGLFRSGTKTFDDINVFVQRDDLQRLLFTAGENNGADAATGEANPIQEIALLLHDPDELLQVQKSGQEIFPDMLVETYREISPDLELYESQIEFVSIIYLSIIMLALIFGIVNTMLMAVLERTRELGMLMAIGMDKRKVFTMVVLETLLLGLIGMPLGMILGFGMIAWLGSRGIDLSSFSETLEMYGMSSQVYLEVDPAVYWQVPLALTVTALLASLYPAFKAIRLRPVEAMRTL